MNPNDQKRVSACCGAEIKTEMCFERPLTSGGGFPQFYCKQCHQPCELVREGEPRVTRYVCQKCGRGSDVVGLDRFCPFCDKPAEPREEKPIGDRGNATNTHSNPPHPMGNSAAQPTGYGYATGARNMSGSAPAEPREEQPSPLKAAADAIFREYLKPAEPPRPKKEPCRKHYWQPNASGPCPDCGYSVSIKPLDPK